MFFKPRRATTEEDHTILIHHHTPKGLFNFCCFSFIMIPKELCDYERLRGTCHRLSYGAVSCSTQGGGVRAPAGGVRRGCIPLTPGRVRHMHVSSLCHACHYIGHEVMPWCAINKSETLVACAFGLFHVGASYVEIQGHNAACFNMAACPEGAAFNQAKGPVRTYSKPIWANMANPKT